MADAVRERVREEYAQTARSVHPADETGGSCCGVEACCGGPEGAEIARRHYSEDELGMLPPAAAQASRGCGNPLAVADLRPGETVLDLGSGGGIDVLLSARRVGPDGFAYGLDMTEEMLDLARANAARAGVGNVEFLAGLMEEVPLPDASVDVVISNCVINLSTDKRAVFREIARVLRPGGRCGIYDIVAENGMSEEERLERGSWVGCIAGALTFDEYRQGLKEAGLTNIEITSHHLETDAMHSCTIHATRP